MPPLPGNAAPSSAQISPSHMTISMATGQPIMLCGPPIAMRSTGMLINGPAPNMLATLSDVACARLSSRFRCGDEDSDMGDCVAAGQGRAAAETPARPVLCVGAITASAALAAQGPINVSFWLMR